MRTGSAASMRRGEIRERAGAHLRRVHRDVLRRQARVLFIVLGLDAESAERVAEHRAERDVDDVVGDIAPAELPTGGAARFDAARRRFPWLPQIDGILARAQTGSI